MKKRYGKLVRDKIPEIIRSNDEMPNIRVINGDEYRRELLYKLIEEAEEVRQAGYDANDKIGLVRELADISEVLDAILTEYSISKETLKIAQEERRKERGGFEEQIFLESVQ